MLAVASLVPLKSTEPYVIMVDKTTGYAQSVRKLVRDEASPMTENEAVVTGEVASYVVARETVDPADVTNRTNLIRLSTEGQEYRRYASEYMSILENSSPLTRRIISIKSVTPDLQTKTARVRFSTRMTNQGQITVENWIATMSYDFQDLNIPLELRYKNPLGFIIESYRVDPESL